MTMRRGVFMAEVYQNDASACKVAGDGRRYPSSSATPVILSAAKDLVGERSSTEILRCDQDDSGISSSWTAIAGQELGLTLAKATY
jgi:hypothetical protein